MPSSVRLSRSTILTSIRHRKFIDAYRSTDDGKTWTKFCYEEQSGARFTREISFPVGAKGVRTLIRARAAFRGGKAGDVDRLGNAIDWNGSWENWRAPCAKFAIIYVKDR